MFKPQLKIPATYMRGGTSKGVFFRLEDLPLAAQKPGPARDALLLRVLGSPDPYGKQIDGMGNASSSTSKAVIVSKSHRPGHQLDYLFGQVSIDKPFVDWSGNCGNLSAAVGAFGIHAGLIAPQLLPQNGHVDIHIWQQNIEKTLINRVAISQGAVQETGDFELDGVTFAAAEVPVTFVEPAADGDLFPTGNVIDRLEVPGEGHFAATLINAGIPTVFLRAGDLGYQGTELQEAINGDEQALARFERIRAYAALKMGLIDSLDQAALRQHTPKIAYVAPPQDYRSAAGKTILAADTDLLVRALSMGKLHHAMMGTAAVAIATAAAIPGTLVSEAAGKATPLVRFGHPSGTLQVGATAQQGPDGQWQVMAVRMSRSARILMEGWVRVPEDCF
ncbi:2-methylaconitate cis-trans isomerase PrpF [Gallaecimonas mangrovi]|uniref:2-methylaconitate cis-trans isomerase PrpF n=1 Tax=Gallaecimonas mangrovi TaxID=2291597 RepID=UPI00300FA5A2